MTLTTHNINKENQHSRNRCNRCNRYNVCTAPSIPFQTKLDRKLEALPSNVVDQKAKSLLSRIDEALETALDTIESKDKDEEKFSFRQELLLDNMGQVNQMMQAYRNGGLTFDIDASETSYESDIEKLDCEDKDNGQTGY